MVEAQQESERDAGLQEYETPGNEGYVTAVNEGYVTAGSVDKYAVDLNINHNDYLTVPGHMRTYPEHSENDQNRRGMQENDYVGRLVGCVEGCFIGCFDGCEVGNLVG